MAGILGLDPLPFSYRQLLSMFDSLMRENWNKTSLVLAQINNCLMSKKTKPSDYCPRKYRPKDIVYSGKAAWAALERLAKNGPARNRAESSG